MTERFIPACAGNARPRLEKTIASPVHPRVCGERVWCNLNDEGDLGSSPRVRGTLSCGTDPSVRTRFIPACAGNATPLVPLNEAPSVHPRVCGERIWSVWPQKKYSGSSPRVRGTRRCYILEHTARRFIPACAGNADNIPIKEDNVTVHPRVCGERALFSTVSVMEPGSSPRVRGTLILRPKQAIFDRFIPACAGNARVKLTGERVSFGSSPRVRGTLRNYTVETVSPRFIPACAGNAFALSALLKK